MDEESNGILGQIFDFGEGVFKRIADLELGKFELKLAREQQALAAAENRAAIPSPPPIGQRFSTEELIQFGLIGTVVIVGGVLAFRALK